MGTQRFVALLRGINVGGRNRIAMADLRAIFEDEGFRGVTTYIQSGNVLFASEAPRGSLEGVIEAMLEQRLGRPLPVVVRSDRQVRNVVTRAPEGFGDRPDTYHSDVIFLKSSLPVDRAMQVMDPKEGVDRVWPGTGVVYFSRLSQRRSQSRMSRIVGTAEYQHMTIRNWTTTTKLEELLTER